MTFSEAPLRGAYIIDVDRKPDSRGFFGVTMCGREFAERGLELTVAQSNISFNHLRGTLRGMHFQLTPHEQVKLVRCTRGAIHDVIIDLRAASPTYLQSMAVELTEENRRTLFVPRGFGHGFQTLADNSEVVYMVSAFYSPTSSKGFRYNDPAFGISWPLTVTSISDADNSWPAYLEPVF
jgi:dTDP-4-dehydrorhamnose 3,5-epimerase